MMVKKFVTRFSLENANKDDLGCLVWIASEFYGEPAYRYKEGLLKIWFECRENLNEFEKAINYETQ